MREDPDRASFHIVMLLYFDSFGHKETYCEVTEATSPWFVRMARRHNFFDFCLVGYRVSLNLSNF